MQIVIDIPEEQIEKCLEESKYIHENEGEKGGVHIVLLYTNKKLEFVDISRKTDFYSLDDRYTILPEGHGRLIDADALKKDDEVTIWKTRDSSRTGKTLKFFSELFVRKIENAPTIIEADNVESEDNE